MRLLCFSGGKDSCATLLLNRLYPDKYPIDRIVYCEVFYDYERRIPASLPQHTEFVHRVLAECSEQGIAVDVISAEKGFLDVFNHVITKPTKHMDHKNKKYGFMISSNGGCACKRDLKIVPMNRYKRELLIKEPIVREIMGITCDELPRLKSLHKNPANLSYLEQAGLTQKDTFDLCQKYDMLSPVYNLLGPDRQKREGCFFCPNAKIAEHKALYDRSPSVFNEFVSLEKINLCDTLAFDKWNTLTKETLRTREWYVKAK